MKWRSLLLVARIVLVIYIVFLIVQCLIYLRYHRTRKLDKRNQIIYALVFLSLILAAVQIIINVWGTHVANSTAENCKNWRGMSVILYPSCLVPVTVLLWVRQRFFYNLNMIQRTTKHWILKLSRFIIYPTMIVFGCLIVFFALLYFTPVVGIMEYDVVDGRCFNRGSRRFSSVFRAVGLVAIIIFHCTLLYLFLVPIRSNMTNNNAAGGYVMEFKSHVKNSGIVQPGQEEVPRFKSIKDLDKSLITKMALITALVVASDILSITIYLALKYGGVPLSVQSLALDIQVLVTAVSNILGWKHWRLIVLPNTSPCPPSHRNTRYSSMAMSARTYSANSSIRNNSTAVVSKRRGSADATAAVSSTLPANAQRSARRLGSITNSRHFSPTLKNH